MFNQKQFRILLKRGIGTRTQKEFAKQTGIAEATINRMLNKDVVPCPKPKTLEIFARHMTTVTLGELMTACGYETQSIENTVIRMENDIDDYFQFTNGNETFSDVESMILGLSSFLQADIESVSYNECDEEIPSHKRGEETLLVYVRWKYDIYSCETAFHVYYIETKRGNIIFCDTDIMDVVNLDDTGKGHATIIKHTTVMKTSSKIAEQRLLNAIFGTSDKQIPITYIGYGFDFNETPEGFLDFLEEHADTFCDCEENIRLYQTAVTKRENLEEIFSEYADENHETGCGAVVADIMKKETGKDYVYYKTNQKTETQNSCIMIRAENDDLGKFDDDTRFYLYECAKKLKIPKFGAVCYKDYRDFDEEKVYDTDTFYFGLS